MLGVIEETQENTEIMRLQEAHGIICLLRNTEEKQTPKQHTSNYCNWSPSHRSVK